MLRLIMFFVCFECKLGWVHRTMDYIMPLTKVWYNYICLQTTQIVRVQNKWRCNYIDNHLSSYCSMAVSLFCGALLFVGLWSVFAGLWAGLVDLRPWPIQRPLLTNPLDAWIAKESSYALQALLANIGAEGAKAKGAVAGIVVASPSKKDPDCMQNPSPISRH